MRRLSDFMRAPRL